MCVALLCHMLLILKPGFSYAHSESRFSLCFSTFLETKTSWLQWVGQFIGLKQWRMWKPVFNVCFVGYFFEFLRRNQSSFFALLFLTSLILIVLFISSPSARFSRVWRSVEPGAVLMSSTVLMYPCCRLSPLKSKHCKTHSAIISSDFR